MHESFASVWERVADAVPDAAAIVQGRRTLTYGELDARATRLASALAEHGVQPGTKAALFLHNCAEYMECLFALSKLRAVAVNVNFRYLDDELVQLVANADAEVLVHHRSLRDRVEQARPRLSHLRHTIEVDDDLGPSEYESLIKTHAPMARVERTGDDPVLWYTGGTTGLPKGALWHQGTLVAHGLAAAYGLHDQTPPASLNQLAEDVKGWRAASPPPAVLVTTPLVHASAVNQANTALASGATVVLLPPGPVDGDTVCATIDRERPHLLQVVGDLLVRRIVTALEAAEDRGEPYDLSSLQRIHNSGAMVSAAFKDALLARGTMHFYDSLGASEGVGFGFALTTAPDQSTTARFRLGPNARLLTAADGDEDVPPGSRQVGVLAVHTSCAIGYHDDPDATAATFRVIDGRLHAIPGDHAILDDDGTLRLLGRGRHCINTGGEKVWPEEVEEALKTHPAVADAAVVGVADPEWGQIVGAVVEISSGVPPTPEELARWVGRHLADYKRPRRIAYADVKRNAIGKPDYRWAETCLVPG